MHAIKKEQRRAPDPADTLRCIDEVLHLSRSAIWEVDRNGVYTYASASHEILLGYRPEELVGVRTIHDFYPREVPAELQRELSEDWIGAGEEFTDLELPLVAKSGEIVWVMSHGKPIFGAGGEVVGFRGADTDITARIRAEAEVQRTNERMQVAARAGGLGFWEHDYRNGREDWDDGMLRIYGIGREDFAGTAEAWLERVHPEDREAVMQALAKAQVEGAQAGLDFRIVRPGGEVRHITSLWMVTRDGRGRAVRMTGLNMDVTALKAGELRLREILDHLPFPVATSRAGADFDWSDPRAEVLFLNRRFTELFGHSVEDTPTVADWAREAFPDADYRRAVFAGLDEQVQRALAGGDPVGPAEARVRTKSGRQLEVVIKAAAMGNELVISFEDVTERNRTGRMLEESTERFRLMLEKAPVAIAYTDRETGRVHLNEAHEKLFGYRRGGGWMRDELAAMMMRAEEVVMPDLARWDEMKRAARERGEPLRLETRLSAEDGSVREVELTSIALPGADFNVMVDLTERNRVLRDWQESGRRLRTVVEHTPVPISYTLAGGEEVHFNRAFTETYGWTEEDVPTLEVWFEKAYPDADYRREVLALWSADIERARRADGSIGPRLYKVAAKDGSVREVEIRAVVFEGEFFGSFLDLTERNRAQRQLSESESSLRRLIENAPVGIVRMETDTGRLWVNKEFTDLLGYTDTEVPTIDVWMQRAYPDAAYRERIMAEWEEALARAREGDGKIGASEPRVVDRNGREHEMQFSAIVIGNEIFGLWVDLTERNRAERLLRERQEQLARVGRVSTLGQLAAALAHELEQPLGAILNNAEAAELLLAREMPDAGELRAIVKDVLADNRRAGAVLDRIRGMVRERSFDAKVVSVGEVLREVARITRPIAAARGIALEISCEPATPPVEGDSVLLQQALLNLVLNSMEAIGTRTDGCIEMQAGEGAEGKVEISVGDNGCGVPPEKFASLVEPFFTTKRDGLGMGLPLVQTIVEQHGGKLRLANQPGRSLAVYLTLPAHEG